MKQLVLFAALVGLLSACQKNIDAGTSGNLLTLEGRFQSEMTVHLNPMLMYVQNRQITDQAIINPYLTRHGFDSYFSTAATQIRTDTLFTVNFAGGDSAIIKFSFNPNFFQTKKIQNSPSEWVLQRRDTIVTLGDISSAPVPIRCDTLGSLINKISPVSYYVDIVPNNQRFYYLVPRYVLQEVNNELSLPLITSAGNTNWNYPSSIGNCSFRLSDYFNIKKDNIENNLLPGDTLVVQAKSIRMVKVL